MFTSFQHRGDVFVAAVNNLISKPAGTFDTALVEWNFDGEVGPASVKESQYRFMVEGIGPVAVVEKKAISAFLIYNNDSKFGKVLIKHK